MRYSLRWHKQEIIYIYIDAGCNIENRICSNTPLRNDSSMHDSRYCLMPVLSLMNNTELFYGATILCSLRLILAFLGRAMRKNHHPRLAMRSSLVKRPTLSPTMASPRPSLTCARTLGSL